jgi:hypothetical protein
VDCALLEERTFPDPAFREALASYVAVHVDIDDAKSFTFEFKVQAVPWMLVIDPDRREKLAEWTEFVDAPTLAKALREVAAARAAAPPPVQEGATGAVRVFYKRTGLSFETGDGRLVLDLWTHLMVQDIASLGTDFPGDGARVRHARFGIQGTLDGRLTALAHVDFAFAQPLLDFFGEYQVSKPLNLRVGRTKVPMGTEYLPRRDFWDHVEPPGYVFGLLPRRDVGAMLYGGGGYADVFLKYWVGVWNGVPDGYGDVDDAKEIALRGTLTPFPTPGFNLDLSAAWTGGNSDEGMGSFRVTDESLTDILRFPATVMHDGLRRRWSLEAELRWCCLALGAEAIRQQSHLASGGATDRYEMEAAAAWAAWMVTGERKSRDEWFEPTYAFGAFELVVRWSGVRGDGRLATIALPGRFTRRASQVAGGLNWYPSRFARVMLGLQRSLFEDRIQRTPGTTSGHRLALLLAAELHF